MREYFVIIVNIFVNAVRMTHPYSFIELECIKANRKEYRICFDRVEYSIRNSLWLKFRSSFVFA